MSKTKIASKSSKKKAVKSAKLVGSTTTRKSNRSRKSTHYKQGKPLLQIAYDVVGNGFTFTIDNNGRIENKFRVDAESILNIMGVPILAKPI
jgi:hypothetical protein|tara:strand:+ start:223 stop:498 length:276 start_codon:yes stop_codon:yes gene_type:complete